MKINNFYVVNIIFVLFVFFCKVWIYVNLLYMIYILKWELYWDYVKKSGKVDYEIM